MANAAKPATTNEPAVLAAGDGGCGKRAERMIDNDSLVSDSFPRGIASAALGKWLRIRRIQFEAGYTKASCRSEQRFASATFLLQSVPTRDLQPMI